VNCGLMIKETGSPGMIRKITKWSVMRTKRLISP